MDHLLLDQMVALAAVDLDMIRHLQHLLVVLELVGKEAMAVVVSLAVDMVAAAAAVLVLLVETVQLLMQVLVVLETPLLYLVLPFTILVVEVVVDTALAEALQVLVDLVAGELALQVVLGLLDLLILAAAAEEVVLVLQHNLLVQLVDLA
jgi:hypothetical protein